MVLSPGTRLGPYQIVAPLGAGGMGEVYRGRDERLGREVAIKVLPAQVAGDPARTRRFEQEARAAGALNHPNILTVHDIGSDAGTSYLVTELLEGESLRELLRRGPLTPREAVRLAIQIAQGLNAAHERGIVHRDLKPENLFLTRDRVAKILDFGLARLAPTPASESEVSRTPTQAQLTAPGVVLGTVGYMAPEQVRGEVADARSDLFALGCVLYEMLSGRRAFARETPAETLTAILRDEPPEIDPGSLPRASDLQRVVRRALAKQPDDRFPSARELALRLAEAIEPASAVPHATRGHALVGLGLTLVLALVAALLLRRGNGPPSPDAERPLTSIAVLPLDNLSGESQLDYLRLALPETMVTRLSHTPSLAVRPFTRSRALDLAGQDPAEAGRALQASVVLTGYLLAEHGALRLSLEAFQVEENRVLWRESLRFAPTDLLALDRDVTRRLDRGLLPALGLGSAGGSPPPSPRDSDAYELFLRAVSRPVTDPEAIELLKRATARDADYAPAWAELGWRLNQEGSYGGGGGAARAGSRQAYQRALVLDPDSIRAAGGLVQSWAEAGELAAAYDAAAALVTRRPESAAARSIFAYVLRYGGLHEEAAASCEEALGLDPREDWLGACAWIQLERGALSEVPRFIETRNDPQWRLFARARLALHEGRRDDALGLFRGLAGGARWGVGAVTACLSGSAGASIDELLEEDRKTFVETTSDGDPALVLAGFAAACGRQQAALDLLGLAVERGFCAVAYLDRSALIEPLRSRPGFAAVRRAATACRERFLSHLAAVGSPYARSHSR